MVRAGRDVVVDGRDIGTVVFPDAELKIFLTATPEARAGRRINQRGNPVDAGGLEAEAARARRPGTRRTRPDTDRAAPGRSRRGARSITTTDVSFSGTQAEHFIGSVPPID